MDLEEWDLLSDEGLIDLHEDGGNNLFSPKSIPNTTTLIDMNYFQKISDPIPVPIQFDQKIEKIPEKLPIETPKSDVQQIKEADHQESVSKVFFKKLKENEFVDMKMDSPKSLNKGILPQIDVGTYKFEEKEKETEQKQELPINKEEKLSKNSIMEEVSGNWDDDHNNEGLNVWKWAMTGIGALFSFGFAAATVSLIVLGNRHKENCNDPKKKELHFQLYTHEKRLKQAVRRATKLNEAITVIDRKSVV